MVCFFTASIENCVGSMRFIRGSCFRDFILDQCEYGINSTDYDECNQSFFPASKMHSQKSALQRVLGKIRASIGDRMLLKVRQSDIACWIGLVAIIIVGFVLFSALATRHMRTSINGMITHYSSMTGKASNRIHYPSIGIWGELNEPWVYSQPDGVFNSMYDNEPIRQVVRRTLWIPFVDSRNLLGWRVPVPFVVPLVIHIMCVFSLPLIVQNMKRGSHEITVSRSLGERALRSSVNLLVLVLVFQIGRLFWASEAWDRNYWSTLLVVRLGSLTYFAYCAMFIVMYLYCVLGTAGLKVRCKPGAKKCSCIRCGYSVDELERCPECDLEVGAFVQSKIRINHWYLGAMLLATFFLPVIVSSVYSILG